MIILKTQGELYTAINIFNMLEVKYNIKSLISSIYECQKKIIINRRFIRELEAEGQSSAHLERENQELEGQIADFQRELRKKYQFSY